MTDTSSSIGRLASLSRSTLLGVIQLGISDWTGRIWFPGRYHHWSESISQASQVGGGDITLIMELMSSISMGGRSVSLQLPLVH